MRIDQTIEPEFVTGIREKLKTQLFNHFEKEEVTPERIVLHVDEQPLTATQCKMLSNDLSEDFNVAVLVLPSGKATTQEFRVGDFCRFPIKIIGTLESSAMPFEIYRVQKPTVQDVKTGKTTSYWKIEWSTDQRATNWNMYYLERASLSQNVYVHTAFAGKLKVFVLSNKLLETGNDYYVTGLVFHASKINQMNINLAQKQPVVWAMNVEDFEANVKIPQAVLDKCKGKDYTWFVKSTCYPFDNSVWNYCQLITLSVFHGQVGFPFNVMLVADATMSKTGFLKKLRAITDEDQYSNSTAKGLTPHFGGGTPEGGALVEARFKCLINEFFENLNKLDTYDRREVLNSMKHLLEGEEGKAVSGKGSAYFKMKGDLFATANWPTRKIGNGAVYKSSCILDFYQDFDAAFCDRILFYPVPVGQREYVTEYRSFVDGIKREVSGDYSKIDYASLGLLSCEDIRSLMSYLKTAKVKTNEQEVQNALVKLIECLPNGVFSKNLEFLLNVASAYAFLRQLSEGAVSNENRVIDVNKTDLELAAGFLQAVISTYSDSDLSMRGNFISSLNRTESVLFSKLIQYAKNHDDPRAKAVGLEEFVAWAGTEADARKTLEKLASGNLCRYTADKAIFLPDLSVEARKALQLAEQGAEIPPDLGAVVGYLYNTGLVTRDREGKLRPLFPTKETPQQSLASAELNLRPTSELQVKPALVESKNDVLIKIMRNRAYDKNNPASMLWDAAELIDKGFTQEELAAARKAGVIVSPVAGKYAPAMV